MCTKGVCYMKIAAINGVNYMPKTVNTVKKNTNASIERADLSSNNVNFKGKWLALLQGAGDGFLGFIIGGPVGAVIGAAIGVGIGAAMDDEEPHDPDFPEPYNP